MKALRKIISIAIIATLALSLVSCKTMTKPSTQKPKPQTTPKVSYKDGTYTGAGPKWSEGSEDATVVIKNGKITSITLRRLDKSGKEINYDKWTGQKDPKTGKVYPNLKKFRVDMANEMIKKQTYNVDTIAGATETTTNWKIAVKNALEKAKK
ncbi:FMN-binding protein [Thermoanaerobacterium saccharolyticum]|uniref:FMN-binding protein n=1 Tax=Thermoanaerobacterium saccharolyticum TaxID=28896 RepID=UPI002FD88F85